MHPQLPMAADAVGGLEEISLLPEEHRVCAELRRRQRWKGASRGRDQKQGFLGKQ